MDIFAVAALGITGALLAVTIKNTRPELAVAVSLATGVILLFYIFDALSGVVSEFSSIIERTGIDGNYFKIALKACVIAYVTQFAAELCRDAGENAVATKVELCGKVSVVVLCVPVISGFLDAMGGLLDKV